MNSVAYSLLLMLRSSFRTRARMQIEILAPRHQLAVLQRRKKRVSLRAADRLLWVILSRLWKQWRLNAGHRQTGNSNCLAPAGLQVLLALEE